MNAARLFPRLLGLLGVLGGWVAVGAARAETPISGPPAPSSALPSVSLPPLGPHADLARASLAGCAAPPALEQHPQWPWVDDDEAFVEALDDYRKRRGSLFELHAPPAGPVHLPAQYAPAEALWIAWPPDLETDGLFRDLVAAAASEGEIHVITDPGESGRLRRLLRAREVPLERVHFVEQVLFDGIWVRDFGPLPIVDGGEIAFVDTRYFYDCAWDDALPSALAREALLPGPVHRTDLWLEGGNLLADGHGTCFTTTALLDRNGAGPETVDRYLEAWFGCRRTLYLEPLAGNAIEHVDMFLHVAGPGRLLLAEVSEERDAANHAVLEANARQLSRSRTAEGTAWEVHRVPLATADARGALVGETPLIRSHLNLVVFNEVVLVPVYRDSPATGAEALRVLGATFPNRRIVPLEASVLGRGKGGLHCVTFTVPRLPRPAG